MVILKVNGNQMYKDLLKLCRNKFNAKPKELYLLPSGTLLTRENIHDLEHVTHAEILVTRGNPPNIDQIKQTHQFYCQEKQKKKQRPLQTALLGKNRLIHV